MFGAGMQFRGLQKPALESIMNHESPILVVMGTGVGKPMLFQIPAKSVSSGTTIFITPLVSLQDHMVERCQQVGISCTKWDSQQMEATRTRIVVLTPGSAVSKTFGTFLNELQVGESGPHHVRRISHRHGQHARFPTSSPPLPWLVRSLHASWNFGPDFAHNIDTIQQMCGLWTQDHPLMGCTMRN